MATRPAPDLRAPDHPSEPWPAWATWVQVAFVMAIVAFVALDADIPRREVVVPLVLLVSSAWLVELFGVRVPLGVKAIVTLGVIGTINIGAERFGWDDPNGLVQITLDDRPASRRRGRGHGLDANGRGHRGRRRRGHGLTADP